MTYATLNNGVKMPMLGYGVFQITDQEQAYQSTLFALETGYRSLDTAAVYGNEKAVGKAIKASGIPREQLFVTNKLWNENQRANTRREGFEQTMENLGLDYLDLYLIHWPVAGQYVKSWLFMESLLKAGRVKAIGVSNFQTRHLDDIKAASTVIPAINQIECHPLLTQKPLIERCRRDGIMPEAWSPLAQTKLDIFHNETLVRLGRKYGKTPAQIILRWDIDSDLITVPKSVTPSRIVENFKIFDFTLMPQDVAGIDALNRDLRTGGDPDNFDF